MLSCRIPRRAMECLLLVALAGCSQGACQLQLADRLPITLADHGDRLVVAGTLNSKQPIRLLLDTGASSTVLDEDTPGLTGSTFQTTEMRGVGGSRFGSAAINHLQIGHRSGTVGTITMRMSRLSGFPYGGLLGEDLLAAYDLDLNLAKPELRFIATKGDCSTPHVPLAEPVYVVPLLRYGADDDYTPHINVGIAGQDFTAILDTGSPETLIDGPAARRLGLTPDVLKADLSGTAEGIGTRHVAAHRHHIEAITVGELTLHHLPATVIGEPLAPGVDILLGLDFIRHVHMWISNSSHTVVFQVPPLPSP